MRGEGPHAKYMKYNGQPEIGRKREALLDRKHATCVQGALATPNQLGESDAASKPRHPKNIGVLDNAGHTRVVILTDWGHGIPDEGFMYRRCCLNVGGYDDRMFPEIQEERIPGPAAFGFHDVEGHAPE